MREFNVGDVEGGWNPKTGETILVSDGAPVFGKEKWEEHIFLFAYGPWFACVKLGDESNFRWKIKIDVEYWAYAKPIPVTSTYKIKLTDDQAKELGKTYNLTKE